MMLALALSTSASNVLFVEAKAELAAAAMRNVAVFIVILFRVDDRESQNYCGK